jgi:hypothetical protein
LPNGRESRYSLPVCGVIATSREQAIQPVLQNQSINIVTDETDPDTDKVGQQLLISPITMQIEPIGTIQNERTEVPRATHNMAVLKLANPVSEGRTRQRGFCQVIGATQAAARKGGKVQTNVSFLG